MKYYICAIPRRSNEPEAVSNLIDIDAPYGLTPLIVTLVIQQWAESLSLIDKLAHVIKYKMPLTVVRYEPEYELVGGISVETGEFVPIDEDEFGLEGRGPDRRDYDD